MIVHVMIDIETTGLSVVDNNILQIAAVPFIGTKFDGEFLQFSKKYKPFNKCLAPVYGRGWDPKTVEFWNKYPDTLKHIYHNMRPAHKVTKELFKYLVQLPQMNDKFEDIYIWAHHTQFDIAFINEYFRLFKLDPNEAIPYRNVRDMKSYAEAALKDYQKFPKVEPTNHDALQDCKAQNKFLKSVAGHKL